MTMTLRAALDQARRSSVAGVQVSLILFLVLVTING